MSRRRSKFSGRNGRKNCSPARRPCSLPSPRRTITAWPKCGSISPWIGWKAPRTKHRPRPRQRIAQGNQPAVQLAYRPDHAARRGRQRDRLLVRDFDANDVTGPGIGKTEHLQARVVSEAEKRADLANRLNDAMEGLNGVKQGRKTSTSASARSFSKRRRPSRSPSFPQKSCQRITRITRMAESAIRVIRVIRWQKLLRKRRKEAIVTRMKSPQFESFAGPPFRH